MPGIFSHTLTSRQPSLLNNQPNQEVQVKMSDDGWEDDGWGGEETTNIVESGPGGDGLSPQEGGGGGGDGCRKCGEEGHFARDGSVHRGEAGTTSAGTAVRFVFLTLIIKSSPLPSIFLSKPTCS